MVKGCVVGSSHQLVVCRSDGTCGLEYCVSTLTILAVVGALLYTCTPLGVDVAIKQLVQALPTAVPACSTQYGIAQRCSIEECLAGSETKLTHLQPHIRSAVHSTCNLNHVVLISGGSIGLVECEIHSSLVLGRKNLALAVIDDRPVGIHNSLRIRREVGCADGPILPVAVGIALGIVTGNQEIG